MKVRSTTQQLILDKAQEWHSLLTLIQSGTRKSHLANEIARELLRDGKSVSKESYYVIILVCAKKGGEEGLANLWNRTCS